jgi:hypothetical protein
MPSASPRRQLPWRIIHGTTTSNKKTTQARISHISIDEWPAGVSRFTRFREPRNALSGRIAHTKTATAPAEQPLFSERSISVDEWLLDGTRGAAAFRG